MIELLDALVGRPSIEYLLGLHEQAVVSIADGYARVTGRPAFVNLHAMVGTANGIGPLFVASKDRTPLVVASGVHGTRHLTPQAAIERGHIRIGENIFRLNLVQVSRNLAADPLFRSAGVTRELPDTLHLELHEREPAIDVACGVRRFHADRDGVLFELTRMRD